jgi:GMP reductase
MQIEDQVSLDYDDVLIKPKRSILKSREQVDIRRRFTFKWGDAEWEGVPIIAANMDTTGTMHMYDSLARYNMMTALHKFYPKEQLVEFFKELTRGDLMYVFYSLGIRKEDLDKFSAVWQALPEESRPRMVCIDVPSAYIETFVDFLKRFRDSYPSVTIMAGNVCTGEMTEALVLAGADIVKVGIGPGSGCLTRRVAGVGVPQLTAVMDCADAAHGLKGWICADGGIVHPGDLGKAFGGGADFIMMGGVLAGHHECEGQIMDADGNPVDEDHPGPKFMKFYGMSSDEAMKKYYGGKANYRASEGRSIVIPYKGNVSSTVEEYLGGLRSTMSYIGAERLKEIGRRITFVRVNRVLNTSLAK